MKAHITLTTYTEGKSILPQAITLAYGEIEEMSERMTAIKNEFAKEGLAPLQELYTCGHMTQLSFISNRKEHYDYAVSIEW